MDTADDLFARLEEKYGGKKTKKRKVNADESKKEESVEEIIEM